MTWNHDFKRNQRKEPIRRTLGPVHHTWLARGALFIVTLSVLGVVLAKTQESMSNPEVLPDSISDIGLITESIPVPHDVANLNGSAEFDAIVQTSKPDPWKTITVKKGDTLSSIFSQLEIHSQLNQITGLDEVKSMAKNIRPGDQLQIRREEGKFCELIYHKSRTQRLLVKKDSNGRFSTELSEDPIETRRTSAEGSIVNSLFLAGKKAGISDNLIMQLADVFGYDIDFALDIRKGDRFKVIYEEQFTKGEKLADGPILAAQFINQGKTFSALRFTRPNGDTGYYTPDGRSLKKAFIRTPVKFSRISSPFDPKRRHPILHTVKAHKGVDYAAPTGTPVKSTGDGKVVFAGWKNGYGKTVVIKHGRTYSTLYAHLSRFKKGIKRGKHVKQGQVIAYVGHTGRATGPHLHYEFRVNNVHKNPVTVKLPKAPPLPKSLRADFRSRTSPLMAQLEHSSKLAAAD